VFINFSEKRYENFFLTVLRVPAISDVSSHFLLVNTWKYNILSNRKATALQGVL